VRTAYLVEFVADATTARLNAIRWLADPGPRRPLHVTLRGPYPDAEDPTTDDQLAAINSDLIEHVVTLAGVGTFHHRGRTTVFLEVADDALALTGDTPDHSYLPHATIFTGHGHRLIGSLKAALAKLPTLRVEVAAVSRVTVGEIDHPVDVEVFANPNVRQALTSAGIDPDFMPEADRQYRISAVDAIVASFFQQDG